MFHFQPTSLTDPRHSAKKNLPLHTVSVKKPYAVNWYFYSHDAVYSSAAVTLAEKKMPSYIATAIKILILRCYISNFNIEEKYRLELL